MMPALIEALRQQMTKSVARQVAATGNLANVDTPSAGSSASSARLKGDKIV